MIHNDPLAGDVNIVISLVARRVSIKVRATGVFLVVPKTMKLSSAVEFFESKRDWVLKAKARIKPTRIITEPMATRMFALKMTAHSRQSFTIDITSGELRICYPEGVEPDDEQLQSVIRKGLVEVYRIEAKHLLPERIAALATKWGFKYSEVSFRNAKGRWGSCSSRDTISLNVQLMSLSDRLIDYVILHELCHTVHKNHGADFHKLLDRVTQGNHSTLRRELKTIVIS